MVETKKHSVLVISYLFPPAGGIAVQRPLKFIKYFAEYGWKASVLTVGNTYSATPDPTLLQSIPADVVVTRIADPLARLFTRAVSNASTMPHPGLRITWRKRMSRKLNRLFKRLKDVWLVPDETILWALRAAWTGQNLVHEQQVDCIYSTSGPVSSHLTGLLVHSVTGVKWVADFRDPWTGNQHFHYVGFRRWLESWLERQVFAHADAIVTVTASFKAQFVLTYPQYEKRMHLIRNGVDPEDFPPIEANPNKLEPFTIFYAGILYPTRSPNVFLQALSCLIRYAQIDAKAIRVQFAGVFDYPGKLANCDLVKALGLENNVEVLGYLPHEEVLSRMQTADALLLIGETTKTAHMYVPGKLYEYLYANKPILALLKPGEAAELIQETNAGIVVDPLNPDMIAGAILQLYHRFCSLQPFVSSKQGLEQFTRKAQTKQLVDVMDSLIQSEPLIGTRLSDARLSSDYM